MFEGLIKFTTEFLLFVLLIISSKALNKEQKETIRSNKYYDKMCFTNSQLDDYFVDFTRATTFNRKLIKKLLNKKTKVEFSLNQYGYYLLLTKLTIYFMRPEDLGCQKLRMEENQTINVQCGSCSQC